MARPRTFDEERALDAAMRTFWEKGYEATSTQDLCAATGLGRSSIYNTFKSKHDLFRRALHRYMTTMNARQLAVLEDPGLSGGDRIRALFALVLDGDAQNRPGGRSLGCLTVNTTVELAGRDAAAAGMLERDTAGRLAALRAAVEAGRRDGSITSTRDAGDLARFLNATVAGLRVSAQGGADRAALEAIVTVALDALTG
ncbi:MULTISPECIES: TetR/AcrR family transcriptional regulator [Streptomyces]|uniref:TetR/AcrR family transcriptional regulator n=2 Tax=Streptomyces TaxID=1883 RepID=A0ABS9JAR5_9ACTN|nr:MULTISPECIES: TetR/AcrR family transcriptional regulator [Streptomyces]MYU31310.1 TetR family transcriptional regulator [Streptomyces sp. SID7810]CUW32420.1 HTH-type transcriptional repressor ComR [Streptomyces reticuli]MCE0446432.1 TetR/AcrR family transcriptional regulator [Streptomyces tricolor]MCG0062632.1 TetR/AcrR family transcriptional regulator [Streptomyces tricolor]OYP14247.1 TetR/AcrR family transcriptional regulator [Streptomyces sp. FBKL.4005]